MSWYQKGKTNLDFTEERDSEWQWHQLGHMQVCTSLQTDNHASTPPLSFLQAGCPSCCPKNSVKALKAKSSPDTAALNHTCSENKNYHRFTLPSKPTLTIMMTTASKLLCLSNFYAIIRKTTKYTEQVPKVIWQKGAWLLDDAPAVCYWLHHVLDDGVALCKSAGTRLPQKCPFP